MIDALVLAGNSFVGQYLCDCLEDRNVSFVATSRALLPNFVPCDLTDETSIRALLARYSPKWIFQCAGVSQGDRSAMDRVHVQGAGNLLAAVNDITPETGILFLGSAAEYGMVASENLPIREECPEQPQSPYGQSKLAQTRLVRTYTVEHNLKTVVMRPFNLIGPGLPNRFLATALIQRLHAAIRGDGPQCLALLNGRATRDFVDVRDAVSAMVELTSASCVQKGTCALFNLASGVEISVLQVAKELAKLAGGIPIRDEGEQATPGHIWRSCGSPDRLISAIGRYLQTDWRHSLADMWQAKTTGWRRSA